MYEIKSEKFEGPIELLLDLIEKEELSVSEFSLARVADDYLNYIRGNDGIYLENLSDFLTVASKLILIKSKALLPVLELTQEEEEEIKDLTWQLEEYRKFKEASLNLGKLAEKRKIAYSRDGFQNISQIFYPPENFNVFDFKKHFLGVLSEIPVMEKLQEELVGEVITLEQKINDLQNTLRKRIETSFADLVSGAADKVDVIVSFLAMLEMVKQRIIEAEQSELFSDIKLKMKTKSSN